TTAAKANYSASAPAKPAASSTGQKVVDAVYSKIGAPYAWGATGPSSFDCSGLTSWAYAQAGKQIPRTSQAQASGGTPVAISDLQPGDIVAYYGGASHVGIYVGNGKIVDALNSGTPVSERPLNYMPIHSAVRF
ncbi:C40 family peptidase, partial [Corynebacterium stationis]